MLDATPLEDSGPFEVPSPREVAPPDNYLPAWYVDICVCVMHII